MFQDKLYLVGRKNLVEIDPDAGQIVNRCPFPEPKFPNDVAVTPSGDFYVTDSEKTPSINAPEASAKSGCRGRYCQPNGIEVDGDNLLVGCMGEAGLRSVNMVTKESIVIANFAPKPS